MEEVLKDSIVELIGFAKNISPAVWAILVKQQIIWGILTIIGFILSIGVSIIGIYILKKRPEWALDDSNFNIAGGVITAIGGCLTVVLFIILIAEGIPQLINPEYFAMMDLKP